MKEILIILIILIFIAVVIISCQTNRKYRLPKGKLDRNYTIRRGESKTITIHLFNAKFAPISKSISNDDIKIFLKNLDYTFMEDLVISNVRVFNSCRDLSFTLKLSNTSKIHTDLTTELFVPRPFLKFDREEESVMSIDIKGEITFLP